MPLLRKRQKILGEKSNLFDVYGQLTSPGAEEITAGANVIAEVEELVKFESFFSHGIFLHVNLQTLSVLLQMGKPSFSHETDRHDPSSDANFGLGSFKL